MVTGVLAGVVVTALASCTTSPTSPSTPLVPPALSAGLLPVKHTTWSMSTNEYDTHLVPLERTGFVNTRGELVVDPVYVKYDMCLGPDREVLVVAQTNDRVDVLDGGGTVLASQQARLIACGPLPGFVRLYHAGADDAWVATLPDLAVSGLPLAPMAVAIDEDWVLMTLYGDDETWESREHVLVSRDGQRVAAAGGAWAWYFLAGPETMFSTGEWPAPASDDDTGQQGYLDQSGRWVAPPVFSSVRPFAAGFAAVSTDDTHSYFVNTSLDKVGGDYGMVDPVFFRSGSFAHVMAYTVRLPGPPGADDPPSGLLAPDLSVLADPATSRTECRQSYDVPQAACLVVDATGTWVITLPDGDKSGVAGEFTTVLSQHLVTTDDRTRVHNTATGVTFDIPAPFHVVGWWWNPGGDAFVMCESDNGLRMVVDATGAPTPFATVETSTITPDGTVYFWVLTGDDQGWVDTTGTWLYKEPRYQLTED